jgi:hypothetical protein
MLEYAANNPFRPADWRWKRAANYLLGQSPRPSIRLDGVAGNHWIRKAVTYKRRYEQAWDGGNVELARLSYSEPDLFWAHYAYNGQLQRELLDAHVLTGSDDDEIAARFGLPHSVVAAYEAVFFNVRDRLDQPGYIVHHVINGGLSRPASEITTAGLWKLYGYFFGIHMLQAITSSCVNPIRVPDAAGVPTAIEADAINNLRLKAAMAAKTLDINHNTRLSILDKFAKYVQADSMRSDRNREDEQLTKYICDVFTAFPFTTNGYDPRKKAYLDRGAIGYYDSGGVELSGTEMMRVALGDTGAAERLQHLTFPVLALPAADQPNGGSS